MRVLEQDQNRTNGPERGQRRGDGLQCQLLAPLLTDAGYLVAIRWNGQKVRNQGHLLLGRESLSRRSRGHRELRFVFMPKMKIERFGGKQRPDLVERSFGRIFGRKLRGSPQLSDDGKQRAIGVLRRAEILRLNVLVALKAL